MSWISMYALLGDTLDSFDGIPGRPDRCVNSQITAVRSLQADAERAGTAQAFVSRFGVLVCLMLARCCVWPLRYVLWMQCVCDIC